MSLAQLSDRVADPVARSAVAWIDADDALVACIAPDGTVSTCRIERGGLSDLAYLTHVVRAIGDRERVIILGPGPMRLALEREYVAIYRRPDRLVDVEPSGPVAEQDLVSRVRSLAA